IAARAARGQFFDSAVSAIPSGLGANRAPRRASAPPLVLPPTRRRTRLGARFRPGRLALLLDRSRSRRREPFSYLDEVMEEVLVVGQRDLAPGLSSGERTKDAAPKKGSDIVKRLRAQPQERALSCQICGANGVAHGL